MKSALNQGKIVTQESSLEGFIRAKEGRCTTEGNGRGEGRCLGGQWQGRAWGNPIADEDPGLASTGDQEPLEDSELPHGAWMERREEEAATGPWEEGGTSSLGPKLQGHRRGSWEKEDQGVPRGSLGAADTPGQGSRDWRQAMTDFLSDLRHSAPWMGPEGIREPLQAPKQGDTGPNPVSLWFLWEWKERDQGQWPFQGATSPLVLSDEPGFFEKAPRTLQGPVGREEP